MSVAGTGAEEAGAQAELIEHLLGQLAAREATLAERDATLAARDATLAERDATLAELEARATALESERSRLLRAYEALKLELLLVKRRLFVAAAERVDTSQLQLEFEELSKELDALAGEVPGADEDGGEDDEPTRRRRKSRGRRNLSEADLPRETVEVPDELFEQLVAEGKAERIGTEPSYKLGYKRGGAYVIVIERVKYRTLDAAGASHVETAPVPPELLKRCLAAPSMLAHIAVDKMWDGLPLFRQEDRLARDGARIDRGSMSRWMEDLGATLGATLVAAMRAYAFAVAFCIATDATSFRIQPGARAGPRRPCRRGHYFVHIADADFLFFEYTREHTSAEVRAMFRGFEGYVQADAASVYDALFRPSDPDDPDDDGRTRIEVACWSHARRKYWEAAFAGERVAREALLRIGKIFELDQTLRGKKGHRSPYKLKKLRQEHLAPLVDELLEFAQAQYDKVKEQRGALRSALSYTVRQAGALRAVLDDGRLRLDNNRAENALRRVVRIRDASLFAGSDEHAEAAGHILTVIATARLHGLDPEAYLRDLIRVLPFWPRDRFLELAPMNWTATRARLEPNQLEREAGVIDVPEPSPAHPAEQAAADTES